MPLQEIVGTFTKERHRFDSGFSIGVLSNNTIVVGSSEPGALVPGLEYVFVGDWKKHATYGTQFSYQGFTQRQPTTRLGVVEYLRRFNVLTPPRINRMADVEGHDRLIDKLKADPAAVAHRCFAGDRSYGDLVAGAMELAEKLKGDQKFQETKLQLVDLFAGRGFPHTLPEACIKAFGAKAAVRIKRDPFAMMVAKLPGCGFLRCDRMYVELGLPKDRMRRQIMCAWHHIHSDGSGTTWHSWEVVARDVAKQLSGNVRVERAMTAAVRAKWLTTRVVNGKAWVADTKRAEDEDTIFEKLKELI